MGCAPQNEGANERLEVRKERMTGSLQNTLPDCLKGQGGRGSRGPCREPDSARTRNSQGWEVRVPSSPSNKCLAVVQEVMERWASLAGSEQQQQRRRRFTMTDLKHQAAEYYRSNEVPQRLEEVLNAMFYLRPEDFYGHLANYFSELSKPPVICKLVGKRVLDGTGHPILEVELSCRVKNHDKSICSSMICSHAEILENASSEAVDADERQRYESINTAIEWINESLNEMLRGLQPTDQHKVDELLCEYFTKKAEEDKERWETEKERETLETAVTPSPPHTAPPGKKKSLKPGKKASFMEKLIPPLEPIEPVVKGSMAIGCISLAVAKAAAMIRDIPLYLHIASLKHNEDFPKELAMPLPMVTVLSCGKSSPGKLNLMKEVMLIPPAWLTVKQGIERCLDVQKEMLKLIESLCKANKGKYEILLGTFKSPDEMVDMYVDLIHKFPYVIALIDPLRKEDAQQWTELCNTLGSKCYLIAENSCRNVSKLLEDQNRNAPKCSGFVVKYTNETKISDLLEMTQHLGGLRRIPILGSPDGESSDDSLVDLAVGLGTRFMKLGGLSRGERVTKYNRLLAIEELLAKNGRLCEREEHEFVDFTEEEEEDDDEEFDYSDLTVESVHPVL
ncbi:enolase 4 isoform X4 [Hemicordylus capensis]|uniref:enolase 4 isoform X4 n=1 Tax=Hemicordylus capensis TaxID=884348 RepID=UPI0023032BE3|nr:enolase 4 isoform X4 [Hemicordylus capensis]